MSVWLGQVTLRIRREPILMGHSRPYLGAWVKDKPAANCCAVTSPDGSQSLHCHDPLWISPPGMYPGYPECGPGAGGTTPSGGTTPTGGGGAGAGPGGGGTTTGGQAAAGTGGTTTPTGGTPTPTPTPTGAAGTTQPSGGTVPTNVSVTPSSGGTPSGPMVLPPSQSIPTSPFQSAQQAIPPLMTQTYPAQPTGEAGGSPFAPPPSSLLPAPVPVQNVPPPAPPPAPPVPPPWVPCAYEVRNITPWVKCLVQGS